MAPRAAGAGARPITRKRNRKRKRRIASSSSESSSSDDSSSDDSVTSILQTKACAQKNPEPSVPSGEDDPSSSSLSSSDDDSEADNEIPGKPASPQPGVTGPSTEKSASPTRNSPSPPPPSTITIPPFINPDSPPEDELALKEKFRKFWMASLAEGFKDDLEVIRKEPNLGQSRLALLIESLAAGADVFSSTSTNGNVNEMEVVVDELS
ncbi:hypothetical protein F5J12DRAFT_847862 [Pisolithus orientalis]|uniref:uncharacterized protein n=1 Tax=Pisolithus orientalis TaxID=936130 RepID=UPI0022245D0A|nr:uncharacterized protein F5J12DRAFT_847862 [Pisolithus orientalis]KAI5999368.1 hypothetical protein F5J12DRAFT_847862 [Pisolithus orientalis]